VAGAIVAGSSNCPVMSRDATGRVPATPAVDHKPVGE
jgi:hypothetical protein